MHLTNTRKLEPFQSNIRAAECRVISLAKIRLPMKLNRVNRKDKAGCIFSRNNQQDATL